MKSLINSQTSTVQFLHTHFAGQYMLVKEDPGADSIKRCHLTSIENPIVEIRRSYDHLFSIMGFPIPVRRHLYIESGPWCCVYLIVMGASNTTSRLITSIIPSLSYLFIQCLSHTMHYALMDQSSFFICTWGFVILPLFQKLVCSQQQYK